MRKVIIAGVSAVALGFAGAALAQTDQGTAQDQGSPATPETHPHAVPNQPQGRPSITGGGVRSEVSKREIKQAQQQLQQQGLYQGKVDGKNGPETMAAVKQFQKKNGLQETGELDARTRHTLGLAGQSGSSMNPHAVPNQPQGRPSITGGGQQQ